MLSRSTPSSPPNSRSEIMSMGSRDGQLTHFVSYNLLKPFQRKLRHIRNVHLFNLNLNLTPVQSHYKSKGLQKGKAKSYTDMNSIFNDTIEISNDQNKNSDIDLSRLTNLFDRQLKLQKFNEQRIVDCFVSIHDMGTDQVLYITETKYKDMNPYFTEFDLSNLKKKNVKQIRIKIWCCVHDNWQLLIKLDLSLWLLSFISETLNESDYKDDNMIILELVDGYYSVPNKHESLSKNREVQVPTVNKRYSSSFDQLMKLNNLQYCIKDSERNKSILSDQIGKLVDQKIQNALKNSSQLYRIKIEKMKLDIESKTNEIIKSNKKINGARSSLSNLKSDVTDLSQSQQDLKTSFGNSLDGLKTVEQNLLLEKVKVIRTLRNIFPISQLSHFSSEFKILGYHLPLHIKKPHMTKHKALEIAFILNLISQLVTLLSNYLAIPLRYPIEIFGSNTYINDPISQLNITMFPLWINNLHNIEKFEYGLLLLNKNIEQLLESIGMRCIDNRNLLGNLNILLICLTENGDEDLVSSISDDNLMVKKRIQFLKRKKSKLIARQQQQQLLLLVV